MLRGLIASFALLFSTSAFAGIFLEPYVGYQTGDATSELSITSPAPATTSSDSKATGVFFGGKIGVVAMRMALGAEYLHSDFDAKEDGEKSKYKEDNIGPFISIPLFYSFRLNGTYFPSAKAKAKDDNSELKGTGYKAGLSMRFFGPIHLSVDYMSIDYDEISIPGATVSSFKGDKKTTLIALSFPLGD